MCLKQFKQNCCSEMKHYTQQMHFDPNEVRCNTSTNLIFACKQFALACGVGTILKYSMQLRLNEENDDRPWHELCTYQSGRTEDAKADFRRTWCPTQSRRASKSVDHRKLLNAACLNHVSWYGYGLTTVFFPCQLNVWSRCKTE